jgi:hypothetical protein
MTIQTVTLSMPEAVYQRAKRAAEVLRRPIEEVIVETLSVVLPPLDDVPPETAQELSAMGDLADDKLWAVARGVMAAKKQARLRALSAAQRNRSLRRVEVRELDELRREYGRVTLRKAQAYALLRERGLYSVATAK